MGSDHRQPPVRFLEAARRALESGRIQEALDHLEDGTEALGPEPERWLKFLVPAIRLALYHEQGSRARTWLGKLRRRLVRAGREDPEARRRRLREFKVLELWVAYWEARSPGVGKRLERALFSVGRWSPWMLYLRWFLLLNQRRLEEFDRFLRRPPCSIPRGGLDSAVRLSALGIRLFLGGRSGQALTVFRSALRRLEACVETEARFSKALVLCYVAQACSQVGLFWEALNALHQAERITFGFRGGPLESLKRHVGQKVNYRAGDYEKALLTNLDLGLRSASGTSFREVASLFASYCLAGRCALLLERKEQARRLLARMVSRSKPRAHPFLRACVHFLRGDLERERGTPSGYRAARRHYDLAESFFGRFGDGDQTWISQVRFSRGLLGLREKKVGEVLEQAEFALKLGRESGSPAAQAQGLLLKSLLLLEDGAPRGEIYEEIVRLLGIVDEPVVLFKILANLYLYSWDLGDRLDLTDLHLRQLNQLKARIPPATYDPLYESLVTRKVLARFQRGFGLGEQGPRRAVRS